MHGVNRAVRLLDLCTTPFTMYQRYMVASSRLICMSHYIPFRDRSRRKITPFNVVGGDPAARSRTATLLRLLPPRRPKVRCRQLADTSPLANSGGATGGVCKEQGRIHRAVVTCGY